ncbi:MAG: sigma-70 family RNA polymerase sigma factor [Polyangiaceae bacterium]
MATAENISRADELGPSGEPAPLPSFSQIFSEHARYVWRALMGLGVADADVQDASQQVFLVLHRKLDRYDGSCTLRTFIYGMCLRVASDYRRRRQRTREHPVETLPERAVPASQLTSVATRQALERLEQALERLPQVQREVFVLFELEELSMAETAQAMGCPLFTAYARLRSAHQTLARELGEPWIVSASTPERDK